VHDAIFVGQTAEPTLSSRDRFGDLDHFDRDVEWSPPSASSW